MADERPPFPLGEENFDWAEAKAEFVEEGRAKTETFSTNGDQNDHYEEDTGNDSEIEGELPPLVDEGRRVMVCIDYELRQTRFASKDYLKWIDEDTGLLLHQYFHHYNKYPVGSKAVLNYTVGMGAKPKRWDRMSLRSLVGLRAVVYVETVVRTYGTGALKGKPMHDSLNYSKVAEIMSPLGRVDTKTLSQLRKRC